MRGCRGIGRRPATLAMVAITALAAGEMAAQPAARSWTVQRDPFVELWYHGLAVAGAQGYGPLPLYSPAYVRAVRTSPGAEGAAARLNASAGPLRAALARDSALEVLHFVPLYFVGERPDAALAALRAALSDRPARTTPAGPLAGRAALVAAALPRRSQRATVRGFVVALEEEWRRLGAADRAGRGLDAAEIGRLQRRWDETLGPALAPYLRSVNRARGAIIPAPAVGLEGRIARGAGGLTIVVVAADAASVPDAPLLAAVRELAFPLLDRVPPHLVYAAATHRLAAQRARELAAVRAGALLLDAVAPPAAGPYRQLFAGAAGGGAASAFERSFLLSPGADSALRSATSRFSVARPQAP